MVGFAGLKAPFVMYDGRRRAQINNGKVLDERFGKGHENGGR